MSEHVYLLYEDGLASLGDTLKLLSVWPSYDTALDALNDYRRRGDPANFLYIMRFVLGSTEPPEDVKWDG